MLIRLKNIFSKFKSYLPILSYLPINFFSNKNLKDIPILIKIINPFVKVKLLPKLDKNGDKIKLTKDLLISERKRKILVEDLHHELILHSFQSPVKKYDYINTRNNIEYQLRSENFNFSKYECIQHYNDMLVVIEKKVPGVSLYDCDPKIVENFLDIFMKNLQTKTQSTLNTNNGNMVYNLLQSQTLLLLEKLPVNSSFSKLYTLCERPFLNEKDHWPAQYNHGQLLPPNILYDIKNKDRFYFIDFEPKLMGIGPYAYDFTFFILYSLDLISPNYIKKIKENIFNKQEYLNWAKHFLAQVVWWSRNKSLNFSQLNKIESRSSIVLSFIKKDYQKNETK